MLTRDELTVIRDMETTGNITQADVRKLLDFADEMLPIRDALVALSAARAVAKANLSDETGTAYMRVSKAFWDLAHKLVETDK